MVGVFFMILSTALMVMAKMLPKSKVMEIRPGFYADGDRCCYLDFGSDSHIPQC